MQTLKHSKQRECIKEYLANSYDHPTADMVYSHVKSQFPNISLGTVYRNLNLLTDIGESLKISTPAGGDRFDGQTDPHNHFICNQCGQVYDIQLHELDALKNMNGEPFSGSIESHSTVFLGKCDSCSNYSA